LSKKTAKAILDAGANYVLSVKDNQPELHEDIKDSFSIQLNDKFDKANEFKGVKAFALVIKECELQGRKTIENHYYICSKIFSAEEILSITSAEWGVEAMHWSLDNTLDEDHSMLRLKPKIIVGNIVRKFALSNVVNFIKSNCITQIIRSFMKSCSFNIKMLQN